MPAFPVENTIFLLLSHHDREHLNRCLKISRGETTVFLCARCTGIITGFSVNLVFLLTILNYNLQLEDILLCFLPFPSVFDWTTQNLNLRESINKIRVTTGLLLGIDLACRLVRFSSIPTDPLLHLTSGIYLVTVLATTYFSRKLPIDPKPSNLES